MVLAQAIAREGMKAVAAGMNPMDLKRGIDAASAAELKKLAREVTKSEEIEQVGTISANGDAVIGHMIGLTAAGWITDPESIKIH